MEIKKPNDIFVATINNPNATTNDMMSVNLNPENTSLLSKDEYKSSQLVQDKFKTQDGKFDDLAFNDFYKMASSHYQQMSDDIYLKDLNSVTYSPFDITRPKDAKTFKVEVEFGKDINPFKQLYGRTGVNSVDDSIFSLREIAQQGKVFDPDTNTWSEKSANDLGLIDKFFGDTLVYAQYDADGTHFDNQSGRSIKHQKGDWKVNDDGNLFLEKLGTREMYGKQIVNPMDMLTTDGSLADKYNFMDSDGRDKSVAGIGFKIAAELAPLMIPGVGIWYGGVKAAVTLASVLPTFYKSFEGLLVGDDKTSATNIATSAENYMAKFTATSISDKGQVSAFTGEQMSDMVSSVFSQLYEQRAAASLSKLFTRSTDEALKVKQLDLAQKISTTLQAEALQGKIDPKDIVSLTKAAMEKVPELAAFKKSQSQLSKTLSLGYMALSTTSGIYGDAIQGGYDRRTAGFATLLAAGGQYAIMMNNRMGDWFLDKTTGYTQETNKALVRQTVLPYLNDVKEAFEVFKSNPGLGKTKLAGIVTRSKNALTDLLTGNSVVGENIWKNSLIEGIEEVTEQAVQDMSTGVVDMMSYLGMTKKKGSFNTYENTFSAAGFEKYMANLVGGIVGGGMFEVHRAKIEPWLDPSNSSVLNQDTKRTMYELIADGHTDEIISIINKQRSKLGNKYISPTSVEGDVVAAITGDNQISQADLIADKTIQMVKTVDGIINASGMAHSDNEIIKKAIIDNMTIKAFEKSKEGGTMGIEGIILSDFKENLVKLTDLNIKIAALTVDAKADPIKQKEDIKQLKEEAKIYSDELNNILTGENAESYFDQAIFYLAKPISENWVVIDKNTYSKTKYGKNFHDLKEDGIGITKQRVDKEFAEYKEGKDFKKNLKVATLAYKEVEGALNPSIAKYTESGYDIERKKTISHLVDLQKTINLFNVDPENKVDNIAEFIKTVKNIEKSSKKRIVPWDVLQTDFADKMMAANALVGADGKPVSSDFLNKKLEDGTTMEEYLQEFISNIVSYLPAHAVDYDVVEATFNTKIEEFNADIQSQIDKLTSNIDSTTPDEERLNIEAQVKDLEDKKLDVKLLPFNESRSYAIQDQANQIKLRDKQTDLQIDDVDMAALKTASLDVLPEKFVSFGDILAKKATELGVEVKDLSDKDRLEALNEVIEIEKKITNTGEVTQLLGAINGSPDWDNIEKVIDGFILKYNNLKEGYDKYNTYANTLKQAIKRPEFFTMQDYGLEAIIKEIKGSKNLDQELLLKVQDMLSQRLTTIKNDNLKGIQITNTELLDLLNNLDDYKKALSLISGSFSSDINDEDIDPVDLVLDEKLLPKYLNDAIKSAEDKSIGAENLLKDLSNLKIYQDNNKKFFENIADLKEIDNNKDSFISNSIYDFIKQNIVSLVDKSKLRKASIFDILKAEEASLYSISDVSNYLSEGLRDNDMQEAINNINLIQSVVLGMSTTEVNYGDPYGFIMARQNFLERNKIKSDTSSLKTVTSDVAKLMSDDLERIKSKLKFLKELSKSNSSKIFNESEITREATSDLILIEWGNLLKADIKFKEKPVIPDIQDILNSKDSLEKKLLNIETSFFNHVKAMNLSTEEQIELMKTIMDKGKYSFKNGTSFIYNKEGDNEITREITQLSDNDFVWYLASTMSLNARDFNNKLLTMLKSDFDKAPFYTQELVGRILYASTVNPELFAGIVEETAHKKMITTDRITYILGGAGTGKTTVIFKALILMLKENNPNLSIWFSAPHTDQAKKLTREVSDKIDVSKFNLNTYNKNELFKQLGVDKIVQDITDNKTTSKYITYVEKEDRIELHTEDLVFEDTKSDLPDLIFIDEATHLTAMELGIINELVKRAAISGKLIKVVVAGDIAQNGTTFEGTNFNVNRVSGIFLPFLNLTVRASNSQKRENNDSLSALVRKSIKIFESPEKSSAQVMNYIGKGVGLKYFLDNKTINGDLLTTGNEIPPAVWTALKNIIAENPTKIIGILSDNGELDPEFKIKLNAAGIPEANIRVYSPNNIQGSESDYFIFKASQVKANHILASLKNLYTYMSRAKFGSIIINDEPIANADQTILPIEPMSSDYTEFVEPLKKELIDQAKEERIKKLTELLDPNFSLTDDNFKFNPDAMVLGEEEILETVVKDEEADDDDLQVTKNAKSDLRLNKKFDDNKFMLHSYYNDINVSFSENGDEVTINKNPNQEINYGLNYLFAPGKTTLKITAAQFKQYTDALVDLKYEILHNGFKIPTGNDLLGKGVFKHNAYAANDHTAEVVLTRTSYSEAFNKPFKKEIDNEDKHLNDGDKYFNLYLKIGYGTNQFYYVHLSSFGANKTIEDAFGKGSESYKKYIALTNSSTTEIVIDPKTISTITSTRMVKQDPTKEKKQYSLQELSQMPGIKFTTDGKIFSKEIVYNLYPTNEAAFIKLYRDFTFGEPITDTVLKELFNGRTVKGVWIPGYKGKPYTAVSFYEDQSHVQLILLKSKKRTWDEIKTIVKTNSLSEKLKSDDVVAKREAGFLRDTLFSGSQVLDLLISLAKERPGLFNKLFQEGFLDNPEGTESKEDKAIIRDELFNTYFKEINQTLKRDIIALASYETPKSTSQLRQVIQEIGKAVKNARATNTTIDEKAVRKAVLPFIRNSNTQWFRHFWNIIQVYNKTTSIIGNINVSPEVKLRYEWLQETLADIFKFWESKEKEAIKKDGIIYYNSPIKTNVGASQLEGKYKTAKFALDKEFLYTDMVPEGPRLLVDLTQVNLDTSGKIVPPVVNKPIIKKVVPPNTNSSGAVIKNASIEDIAMFNLLTTGYSDRLALTGQETEKEIKNLIYKATLINKIIGTPNNTTSINDLVRSTIADLEHKVTNLSNLGTVITSNIAVNSLQDSLVKLENHSELTVIQKAIEVFSDKLEFLDGHEVDEDVSEGDLAFRDALIKNWNKKAFTHLGDGTAVSLSEYLNSIKDASLLTIGQIVDESEEEYVLSKLSMFIYEKLGLPFDEDLLNLFEC